MDGLLKDTGSAGIASSAAAYFPALNMCVGLGVHGLVSSTITKLQAVTLSLKCVLFFCFLVVYLDSQAAISACVLKIAFATPDFHNPC
ncbi:hypothetical protein G9A89_001748 [Geosiphon pyriformis]|nr:hypothetical protein G9A89_001748 [Geosiphon pyriformis]